MIDVRIPVPPGIVVPSLTPDEIRADCARLERERAAAEIDAHRARVLSRLPVELRTPAIPDLLA